MSPTWRRSPRQRLRRFLRWLIRLRGSPEAIGGGMAIGTLVAFTPTLGVQMALALLLATLCNANRPVSALAVWISNPATVVPIYAFTYWVGTWFWPGAPRGRARETLGELVRSREGADPLAWTETLRALAGLGTDVFVPLWIGGLLVGAAAGAFAYAVTLVFVRDARRRLARRRQRRRRGTVLD